MSRRLALLLALTIPVTTSATEIAVPFEERSTLSLTLHQDGPALIRDRRPATLERGTSTLILDGIPRTIRPGSAAIEAPGLSVAEHWIDGGALSAERQLAAHIGRTVSVIWDGGGPAQTAKVLSSEGTPLFEAEGKVVAGQPQRIVYDGLGPGLASRPSFRAQVETESSGRRELELSYSADGLGWSSLASAELKGDHLALSVWANLSNASGADFNDATLRLVAGTTQAGGGAPKMMMAARPMAESPSLPIRDAVGPYHVYTLPRPVTLRDGENRQVPLIPPAVVTVSRELALDPQGMHLFLSRSLDARPVHPVLRLAFSNTAKAGLGKPVPAGPIRVTMRGPGGDPVLLGEDMLPALPEGAEARLNLGQSFDVTARRVQTDFQKVSAEVTETAWEVKLANGAEQASAITIREAFRPDWLILDESAPHTRESPTLIRWVIQVPAKGEAVLRYRVRMK
ncbi:hypothetical protein CCC_00474 [Paramagnetospirillum magnetotacticum MS-1]|uniref:DUF4139 domain-containing protein n=1 Tax=Paramagnetospirillum magnetotacticum MS-1 TaxID=272627 RepID=A0A0C2YQL5_PARME|nr:DUF4139 domain-containing protein [Paramagnetospirillum magnetotacticum]KIL97413.1 hypothetical protein CCC_00474 [Paramagnetospirillum magnetotacticum MS-1]